MANLNIPAWPYGEAERKICERIDTGITGKVIIRKSLIRKFKSMKGIIDTPDEVIKDMMINRYQGWI